MTEQALRIQEKFSVFVNSPDYGGPTDIFSRTELIKVKKNSESLNTSKKADLISGELEKLDKIEKQLEVEIAKIRDKDQTSNNTQGKPFKNRFPYGECDYDSKPQKLDSISLTSPLIMDESSRDFSRLCQTLFPDIYGEIGNESKLLMDFFGSMADYPYIDPRSQGLLSIANLYQLFQEFYMTYDSKDKIDQTAFFRRFLEISSLNTDTRNKNISNTISGFKDEINDIYGFDPALWWNTDDKGFFQKNFGNRKNAFGDKVLSDSYGAFFEAPVLCEIIDAQNRSGAFTFSQSREVDVKNTGIYDSQPRKKYILSNDSRVFCLLLQKYSEGGRESEILDKYKISDLRTNSDSYNKLRLLYNVPNIDFKAYSAAGYNITTNPKNNYFNYVEKTNNYFNGLDISTQQKGGRKKNTKGGTMQNLYDISGIPNLLANRVGKPFNPALFVESLKKYQSEKLRFSDTVLQGLLKKIKDETFLPLILDNANKNYGTEKLTYEELRHLFLWSSVYTTYKKLLAHFFKNIYACYSHYNTLIEPFYKNKSFDKKNQLVPLFFTMKSNIDNLLIEIKRTIALLEKNLIVKGADTNVKNLFAGFDVMNPGGANTSGKQLFPSIIEDKFFKDYCLMALIPDHFKSFIQLFCLKFGIKFGGIPIVLSEYIDFIKNLPVCFQFFLQYRIITSRNLKDQLTLFKKEIKEQQSPAEIKVIMADVDKEIDRIFRETQNLNIPNLMDKYRKYIEFMISFGMNNFITILKKLIRNLNIKGTGQFKNKSESLDSLKNSQLIGMFKQEIYYFMQKLRDRGDLPENLYLFIFGKLFNFIYRLDFLINSKKEISGSSFKELVESIGIKLDWTSYDIKNWAQATTKILTTPEFQKTVKTRWLGLKSVSNTSNAAKTELSNIYYNPAIYTPQFWGEIESKFLSENSNKKLLILAVEIGKLGKNVYLINPFEVAQSHEPKPVIKNNITTIEEVDNNGVVQKEFYGANQIIELKNFSIFKGDIQTDFKKKFATKFAKGLRKDEIGHAFAEYFKIRKNKGDRGFRQTDLMKRLLADELDRYVDGNNKRTTKLQTCFLMGYDKKQLQAILQKNVLNLPKNKRFATNTTSYDDYQLYLIKSDELQHIQRFRLWLWKLLMSKPWFFNKEYMNPGQIPLSDFSHLQVPFEKLFIKTGEFGLSSYLLEYFKEITKTMKDKYNTSKNKNANLKSLLKFVPMTGITQLELAKVNTLPELKVDTSKEVNNIKPQQFANAATGVSGASSVVSSSASFGTGIGSNPFAPTLTQSSSTFGTGSNPFLLASARASPAFGASSTFGASPASRATGFALPPRQNTSMLHRSLESLDDYQCQNIDKSPLYNLIKDKYPNITLDIGTIGKDKMKCCLIIFKHNPFKIWIHYSADKKSFLYWYNFEKDDVIAIQQQTNQSSYISTDQSVVINDRGIMYGNTTMKFNNEEFMFISERKNNSVAVSRVAPSQANIQRAIETPFYRDWVNFVIQNHNNSKYLIKGPIVSNENDSINLLKFFNKEGNVLVRIYYDLNTSLNYIWFKDTIGTLKEGVIKETSNRPQKYYAEWSPTGRSATSIRFDFNKIYSNLMSYKLNDIIYNLQYDETNGGYYFSVYGTTV